RSHFRASHTTAAVQSEDMAYTSDSTAEYQNVSVKLKAKAPTVAAKSIGNVYRSAASPQHFRPKALMVQNRNVMVNPLHTAEPAFIQNAICSTSPPAKLEKMFCNIKNNGAPG